MSNQIAGLRLTGTVTGTGNINLTSIVPNVGSIPASNLTVGQSGWAIVQTGTGATLQREIVYVTYSANTPGAGIMSRGEVRFSTSSNTKITFAQDTTVIVEFDVPDINIPHKLGDTAGWHLLGELATALGLDIITAGQVVNAGNVNTLFTANTPNKRIDFTAFDQANAANFVEGFVISGPDAGAGSATAAEAYDVGEGGSFALEQAGVAFNVRNSSGGAITFTKNIRISLAPTA